MDISDKAKNMSQPLPDSLTSSSGDVFGDVKDNSSLSVAADLSKSVHTVFSSDFMGPLADNRSTARLLNALAKLEAYHANLSAATGHVKSADYKEGTSGTTITAELTQLRQQNKKLRKSQKMAISRLDDLLERLPGLAAVSSVMPDDLAQSELSDNEEAAA